MGSFVRRSSATVRSLWIVTHGHQRRTGLTGMRVRSEVRATDLLLHSVREFHRPISGPIGTLKVAIGTPISRSSAEFEQLDGAIKTYPQRVLSVLYPLGSSRTRCLEVQTHGNLHR